MSKLMFALMAAAAALITGAQAAAAACGAAQPITTVEFRLGSAALGRSALAEQERAIRAALGTSELVSYRVLAMGDLSEGASWETAPAQARLADQALARARGAAVLRLLRRLPAPLRTARVSSAPLPNRPATSPITRLNNGTGAIIEIGVRFRDANGIYIAC